VYESVPEFGQLVEYVTEANPVERENEIYVGAQIHPVVITQHNLEDARSLEAIKNDYLKIELEYKRTVELLPEKELDELKLDYALDAKLIAVHPVDAVDAMLLKISAVKEVLPIDEKLPVEGDIDLLDLPF